MERDSFIFYRSFAEAIDDLSDEEQLKVYRAIKEYALNEKEIKLTGTAKGYFRLMKPLIAANTRRYKNGCNGGRKPNSNQEETKLEPTDNQYITKEEPNSNQEETKLEPNNNVNGNENVNDNSNGNDEKQPQPLLIKKIQEEAKKLDIILDTNRATIAAASGIDPSWLEGSSNFAVFAKEWLEGNPKYRDKPSQEMVLLFTSAFAWENLREEYPKWKQEKEQQQVKSEKLRAIESAREKHPTKCEFCGGDLQHYSSSYRCKKCLAMCSFDEKTLKWVWRE
jgi:hypothetical protein